MKKSSFLAACAAFLVASLSVPAANAELTQTERDQFRTDPVGAIAGLSSRMCVRSACRGRVHG
ncbi:hypothetical protein MHY13_06340 [Corynebacterium sp. ACRPE]|uniref:hypothetical protein n=1 Tax=Corynebacterium sp. ACRPE TaxID=2918196 RepID=UPI001EF66A83|nr:hypothetical protein [Corynebacterium sp. ACRPE]MCG7467746.1 hypothetical protein [Corynebacterium sp. ACRPE]